MMLPPRAALVLIAALALLGCRASGPSDEETPAAARLDGTIMEPHPARLELRSYRSPTTGKDRGYWVSIPAGTPPEGRWPLILFLHGLGERGDDPKRTLIHGVTKELGVKGRSLPFVVLGPQCPRLESEGASPSMWPSVRDEILGLADALIAEGLVDPERQYLTGLSMGGHGAWDFALHAPARFAAIAPVCGWGDPDQVHTLGTLPVWAFHGGRDQTIPAARSVAMIDSLRRVNPDARLTLYPDLGHNCWDQVYGGAALYAWFLEHRRRP